MKKFFILLSLLVFCFFITIKPVFARLAEGTGGGGYVDSSGTSYFQLPDSDCSLDPNNPTYCDKGTSDCPHCTVDSGCCDVNTLSWTKYQAVCVGTTDLDGQLSKYKVYTKTYLPVLSTGDKCVNTTDISMDARDCNGNSIGVAYKYCCTPQGTPANCLQIPIGNPLNDGIPPMEGYCPTYPGYPQYDGYTPNGVTIRSTPCEPVVTVPVCNQTCYDQYFSGQKLCAGFNTNIASYSGPGNDGSCGANSLCCTKTDTVIPDTCGPNGGFCYTDPVANTCAGYSTAYPQFTYTPVSGTCNNGGTCCSVTGNNYMYYCRTSDYTCHQTSTMYPAVSTCQANLVTYDYLIGPTDGVCYTQNSACGSACIRRDPVNGVCGNMIGTCNSGTFFWIDSDGSDGTYNWICAGIYGGSPASCSAASGCNSGADCNDGNLCTSDLCSEPGTEWSMCNYIAFPPTNGVCGVAIGSCSAGNPVNLILNGGTYEWGCVGSCGGTSNNTCTAPAGAPPVIDGLVIKNSLGNVVGAEAGNRNQICQTGFNNINGQNSRLVTFEVSVSDPDGIADITNITLTWNGNNIPIIGSIGTVTTFGLQANFPNGYNNSSLYPIVVTVTDSQGLTDVDNTRQFKIWDCQVSVSGTGYDGSATGGACSDSNSYNTLISNSDTYNLSMDDVGPGVGTDKTMNVSSPTYSSQVFDPLIWGRDYFFNVTNFVGNPPGQIRINGSTCSSTVYTINSTLVDPYSASVSFTADFSSVLNRSSWWRAENGGVMSYSSVNSISGRVPGSCVTNCEIAVGALAAAPVVNNTGRNDFQTWMYSGSNAKLAGVNNNYDFFYNQYYVRNGIGQTATTLSGGGKSGIYFIDGNLDVTANIMKNAADFLMIIVKGDVNVDPAVTQIDGILVANNITALAGTNATPLIFNGSLFAFGAIDFSGRGYSVPVTNNTLPAVRVVYNPQLIFNLPPEVNKVLTNWQWGNL